MTRPSLILILALALANLATAEDTPLHTWFVSAMQGEILPLNKVEPVSDIRKMRQQVFAAYKEAALKKAWDKQFIRPNEVPSGGPAGMKILSGHYRFGEGLDMPYVVLQRGEKPANGWPLIIAMHGGGGTSDKLSDPHAWPVNTQEWKTQIHFAVSLYPTNAIYFVPRMVNDNQGRWWKEYNYRAYSTMIRDAILFWDVDPNRVYMLGISEGGYGTETLACRYPDKFAAADGMACGEGTSIHVENLRNLPFRTDVGEEDTSFGRVSNAIKKHELLKSLQKDDPGGYINDLEVQAGRGHGINYRPGPEWLMQYSRNPHPKRVTYTLFEHDGVKNKGAYWLQATNDLDKKVIHLEGQMDAIENTITIKADATKNDEKVQVADGQQPLADSGETVPAKGLKIRLWLHETLLDLSKPVKIIINGKVADTITPKLEFSSMCESLMAFGDPNYTYPCKIDVVVP